MPKWTVVSGEYSYVEPVLDYGEGPTYYTCDVVEVEAENKKQAKVFGLREMRKQHPRGFVSVYDENPFKGMKVFPYIDEKQYEEMLEQQERM